MFTGIITEVGTVASCVRERSGLRLRIDAPSTAKGLPIGGSVAVDGVCLTAIAVTRSGFEVQVVPETVRRSTLGPELSGRRRKVNLERPVAAGGEIAGHFVQGHVDAHVRVAAMKRLSGGVDLALELPESLHDLVVEKGSIAVNGVSLTVASLERGAAARGGRRFTVALIPHTIERTNLGDLHTGDRVNLEVDILGKYVQTFMRRRR